jgi:tRNA(adenine34) deaminase
MKRNDQWMKVALREAERAFAQQEVPIGAVVVSGKGEVLGKGYNQREQLNDPTAHAEILAITAAANTRRDWRLDDCTLYVTLEPCPMCAGAIVNARIPTVVYGTEDKTAGACGSRFSICGEPVMNHKTSVVSGVLEERCRQLLAEFFSQIRSRGDVRKT